MLAAENSTRMDATDFPDDLVQTQAAWNATYDELAALRHRDTTALRHRLLRLSVRLWWHPYWETLLRCWPRAPSRARWSAPTAPPGPRDLGASVE